MLSLSIQAKFVSQNLFAQVGEKICQIFTKIVFTENLSYQLIVERKFAIHVHHLKICHGKENVDN